MEYRLLGRTGLSVSVIGFGASPLGGVFEAVPAEQGHRAVQHAIDCGINLFDVSPYYGLTLAEERLGEALLGRRDEVVLATKCGRYGADQFDFSAECMTRELENSLRRLQTDHVDLLQLHDIEFGSIDQILNEAVPVLQDLQKQGKTRFIGITGYWPSLLARVAEVAPIDTVLNYCHLNLLMDDMGDELTPTAERLNIGLMNASPLHMGLLGGGAVPKWHPAPPEVKTVADDVKKLCRAYSVNPAVLALSTCLGYRSIASTFIGLSSVAQVEESLLALSFEPPTALRDEISALTVPVFNTVWPSGLTENQPGGVSLAH